MPASIANAKLGRIVMVRVLVRRQRGRANSTVNVEKMPFSPHPSLSLHVGFLRRGDGLKTSRRTHPHARSWRAGARSATLFVGKATIPRRLTDGGAQTDRAAWKFGPPRGREADRVPRLRRPIRALVDDMVATMRDADGVGIAGAQVYESLAIFIVASRANPRYPDAPDMEPEVVINPEIVESSIEMVDGWEGCLSIPGLRGKVPRHQRIRVRYSTPDGEIVDREFQGFIARIFQHEFDHLNGIVFLDRMANVKELMMEREYRRQFAG